MKLRNQFLKYKLNFKDGDNEDEGGKGGGGGEDKLSELSAEVERLRNHNTELLGEKKKETEKRREAEAEAQRKKDAKALADEDYKQLYESSENERKKSQDALNTLKTGISSERINTAALKIASDIADGANIENLSTFIIPRLKYTEDGLKVTDSNGNLTVSSLDDLKAEFKGNARFASLIRGSQASGGGANGGKNGSGASKEMNRDDWNKLSHFDRGKFSANGGKVIN